MKWIWGPTDKSPWLSISKWSNLSVRLETDPSSYYINLEQLCTLIIRYHKSLYYFITWQFLISNFTFLCIMLDIRKIKWTIRKCTKIITSGRIWLYTVILFKFKKKNLFLYTCPASDFIQWRQRRYWRKNKLW